MAISRSSADVAIMVDNYQLALFSMQLMLSGACLKEVIYALLKSEPSRNGH